MVVCAGAGRASAQASAPPIRVLPLSHQSPTPGAAVRASAPDARLAELAQRLRHRLGPRLASHPTLTAHQASALGALQQRAVGTVEVHLRPGVGTPSLV